MTAFEVVAWLRQRADVCDAASVAFVRSGDMDLAPQPYARAQELRTAADWIEDCARERGRLLAGKHGHWCIAWDGLPVDESCPEWPCACSPSLLRGAEVIRESGWARGDGVESEVKP